MVIVSSIFQVVGEIGRGFPSSSMVSVISSRSRIIKSLLASFTFSTFRPGGEIGEPGAVGEEGEGLGVTRLFTATGESSRRNSSITSTPDRGSGGNGSSNDGAASATSMAVSGPSACSSPPSFSLRSCPPTETFKHEFKLWVMKIKPRYSWMILNVKLLIPSSASSSPSSSL